MLETFKANRGPKINIKTADAQEMAYQLKENMKPVVDRSHLSFKKNKCKSFEKLARQLNSSDQKSARKKLLSTRDSRIKIYSSQIQTKRS